MADNVETLGVDLRTRVKSFGAKDKATRKEALQKKYMTVGVKKFVREGMLPARIWESGCSGDSSQRIDEKLRRQMQQQRAKKSTTSLSLFMEASGLEVEEELSTMAAQNLGRRGADWKMVH